MAEDARYGVQVLLRSGLALNEEVTGAQANDLVATGRFEWPGDHDQAWKQRAAIATVLAERLQKGTGLLTVTDPDGQQWLIATANVDAVGIRDRAETPDAQEAARRLIGFEPIIVPRAATGQAGAKITC